METTEGSGATGSSFKNAMLIILGAGVVGLGAYSLSEHQQKNKYKADLETKVAELQLANSKTAEAIENNLAEVTAWEGIIASPSNRETGGTAEERIVHSIQAIQGVMQKNREMIENLRSTLGDRDKKLQRFQRLMAKLEKRIGDYKTQTASLTEQTETLRTDLDLANKMSASLQEEVNLQQKQLDDKTAMIEYQEEALTAKERDLNTAYYAVGTYKELKENNVVDKEGGLIGIGSAQTLKTDFNRDQFSRIDIFTYTDVPVFSKTAKIITNHSSDSYETIKGPNGEVQWIKITNPEKFWENSKYLVIVKKGQTTAASASVSNQP